MTDAQRAACHGIIHTAATSGGGVAFGLAQLPCADAVVLVPIQITMVVSLGAVFGVHIIDAVAKGVVLGMAATYGGRGLTQVLFGWIPVLGNTLNAGTAFGLTEWMGWAVADKFDRGELRA